MSQVNEIIGKLQPREIEKINAKQRKEHFAEVKDSVESFLRNSDDLGKVLVDCSLGGKLVPSLLAKHYADKLPTEWRDIATPEESPEFALAKIALSITRSAINQGANEVLAERGIHGDNATRTIVSVFREVVKEDYASVGVPMAIEKPTVQQNRDQLRRAFAAFWPTKVN